MKKSTIIKTLLLAAWLVGTVESAKAKQLVTTYDFTGQVTSGVDLTQGTSSVKNSNYQTYLTSNYANVFKDKFSFQFKSGGYRQLRSAGLSVYTQDEYFSILGLKAGDQVVINIHQTDGDTKRVQFAVANQVTGKYIDGEEETTGSVPAWKDVMTGETYTMASAGHLDLLIKASTIITSIVITSNAVADDAITDIDLSTAKDASYLYYYGTEYADGAVKFKYDTDGVRMLMPSGSYYLTVYGATGNTSSYWLNAKVLGTETNYTLLTNCSTNKIDTRLIELSEGYNELYFTRNTWAKIIRITVVPTSVTTAVTLGSKGISTFTPAMNVTKPSGVKAYRVTAADASAGTLTATEISGEIPAYTGVILVGEGGVEYTFSAYQTYPKSVDETNIMKGVVTNTVLGDNCYALKANTTSFVPVTSGTTIPGGKAYLQFATGARVLNLVFDDEVTSIKSLSQVPSDGEGVAYNLRGQRVAKPAKGLYIMDGRKFIAK